MTAGIRTRNQSRTVPQRIDAKVPEKSIPEINQRIAELNATISLCDQEMRIMEKMKMWGYAYNSKRIMLLNSTQEKKNLESYLDLNNSSSSV